MVRIHLPQWLTLRLVFAELVLLIVPIILFAINSRPVYAQGTICSGTKDYGDAPAGYGYACATPDTRLSIGSTVPDSEAYPGYPSVGANGDDNNGTKDENFLNPLTPIDLANSFYTWTVPITNTYGNAYLAGWIDFNGNGTFDSNERASASVTSGTTVVTLTWAIPTTVTPTLTTYARLRISTDSNVGATNDYGIGEVEDYVVTAVESLVCTPGRSFYFIDGTNADDATISMLDLASGVVTTLNNPPSQGRINGIAVDLSRGLVYYQNASLDSSAHGLYYWDAVLGTLTTGNGTVTNDAGTAPLSLPLGNGWKTASAAFANGKYYAGIDGGDLGTVYEITLNAAGTGPVSSRELFTPNANCGESACNDYGDLMVVGNRLYASYWSHTSDTQTQHLDVYDINSQQKLSRWSSPYAYDAVNAWAYQLGRDGNGQIYAVRQDNGNVYTVNPVAGTINESSSVGTTGGVVFDASECPVLPLDFGDAPNSYGTDVGPRAARHSLNSNLRLGATSSALTIRDLHGFSSTAANGDDLNNYNGSSQGGTDDEDSVSNIARLRVDATTYSITNVVVYNNTGSTATLYGWVDFNRDGVFDPSERATVTVPSSGATQSITITWNNLSGLVYGMSYIRLRLSTSTVTTSTLGTGNDGAFLATGYAPDGEVEDYLVPIDNIPTAVSLSSFSAPSELSGLGDRLIPISLFAGATLMSVGGLIIYRYNQTRRRRRDL